MPGRRNTMCQDPEISSATLRKSENSSLVETKQMGHSDRNRLGEVSRGQTLDVVKDHNGGLDFILSMMRYHWRAMNRKARQSGLYIEKITLASCDHTKAAGHHLSCRNTYNVPVCPSLRVLYLHERPIAHPQPPPPLWPLPITGPTSLIFALTWKLTGRAVSAEHSTGG